MRRILTNSTALVACLSLSLPMPVAAQQEGQADAPELCADGSEPPCATAEEAPAAEEPAAEPQQPEAATEPAAAPEEPAPAAEEPAAPEAAEAPQEPAPEAAEAPEEPVAAPEAAETAEEPAATPEDAAVAEEPVATPEAAEAAEPSAAPADGADAATAEGAEPAQEPAAAPDAAQAEPDEVVEETAPAEEVDGPAPAEVIEMEQPVESEADIAIDVENATEEDSPDATQAEEPAEAAPPPARATTTAAPEATEPAAAETTAESPVSPQEAVAAETAAAAEAAQAAQSAAAATAAADAEATVTEETVTEETSRSSDENFASRLTDTLGLDDEDTRNALLTGVLGALGGYTAGQMLGDRQIVASSEDRVVVQRPDGQYQLLKDDNALLRQPGSEVRTETFGDGSTRTTVYREDGSQIVTVRDADLRVVRRTKVTPDGQEWLLIDDTTATEAIDVSTLPQATAETGVALSDEEALRRALDEVQRSDRRYSLAQVREVQSVRAQAPVIQIDSVTFETGSAAISPDQARQLNELGQLLSRMIEENPREIFLVEGHTDAVGDAAMNLALSDRRAESVALALTEYYDVPPENLVVQGYGERYLRVQTDAEERQNRRAAVRRITGLLQVAAAN